MPGVNGNTLEKEIEDPANTYAEKLGVFHRKYQSPNRRSAPDRLYIYKGFTWYIEYKAPGKKPSPGQQREIARMREFGAHVYVIDNLDYAKAIIEEYIFYGGFIPDYLHASLKSDYSVF